MVDETGSALAPRARIQERIRRVANNPIRRRKETAPRQARGGGGGPRNGLGGGGNAKRAGGGGGGGGKAPKKVSTNSLFRHAVSVSAINLITPFRT